MLDLEGDEKENDPRRTQSEPPTPKPDWDNDDPNMLSRNNNMDNVYADSKPSDPLGKLGKTYSDAET